MASLTSLAPAPRPLLASTPRRGPLLWRLTAVTLIWATSLFVLALWVSGGGIQSTFAFDGDTFTTLGRVTGLGSANLLLYQVLLMARVPVFERGFGRDGITRMHRLVGFWSFWLLMAHLVLITIGYAITSSTNVFVQAWDFVWDYPGMLLATAGTGLLILVVVTSIRRARRRLRYESWHLLHLYGYLGAGLAIPHMLWTGADFTASVGATVYWWALWAVTAACVLWFRIALPLIRSARHRLRVIAVEADGPDGICVHIAGRQVHRLGAQAGQFFVWRFLDGPGWSRGHPFSLAAAPLGEELVLSARRVGDGTERLAGLRPGTRVMIEGPYGSMTGERRTGSKLLMLGAGAGVAPLVALLQAEPYAPGEAILITRDHSAAHGLRRADIDRLAASRGLVHYTLNGRRAASGASWLPASHAQWDGVGLLRHVAPDLEEYDVYLCGPTPWMRSIHRDLRTAGLGPDRIHSEAFAV
ncbi:ferric reductase-like transmembrane domain-containing protein [Microbacterium sp. ASV81]|uniref:Ferric reductase-like transmembrane domain-containing protein n=1 Tax=Microbacterium capsulatum TaxID=3041921 RepID=A0ABU0XHK0_9MICO|nr:ferric reductase-like transmembrane domain-containing protein [Microbacterium sp. ASV81]MDQ4214603.1 ferric reductase-like transmembrane domain-containing protein [Microbacterium sp. ASV81]